MVKPAGEEDPGSPCDQKEEARKPKAATGTTRQNDGLEGIEQRGKQTQYAGKQSDNSQSTLLFYASGWQVLNAR
jgi:hypothetical protein